MPIPQIGFIPKVEAVAIDADRFDLTSWAGVLAWLNAGKGRSAIELFHIHQDDIAALEAAMKEETFRCHSPSTN